MSHDLSLFLEGGGGLRKTTLSLFKDVTLRLGGEGSKARVTMSLFLPLNLLMKVSWWPIDFTFAAGTIWNFKFNLVPI